MQCFFYDHMSRVWAKKILIPKTNKTQECCYACVSDGLKKSHKIHPVSWYFFNLSKRHLLSSFSRYSVRKIHNVNFALKCHNSALAYILCCCPLSPSFLVRVPNTFVQLCDTKGVCYSFQNARFENVQDFLT